MTEIELCHLRNALENYKLYKTTLVPVLSPPGVLFLLYPASYYLLILTTNHFFLGSPT